MFLVNFHLAFILDFGERKNGDQFLWILMYQKSTIKNKIAFITYRTENTQFPALLFEIIVVIASRFSRYTPGAPYRGTPQFKWQRARTPRVLSRAVQLINLLPIERPECF